MEGDLRVAVGIPARLTAREGRRFAFTVGTAFLVLAAISAWRGHTLPPRVLGALGGALLLAGLVVPGRLSRVHRAWMGLALALSKVTTPIMIGGGVLRGDQPDRLADADPWTEPGATPCARRELLGCGIAGWPQQSRQPILGGDDVASAAGQMWAYLKVRKKWWLLPILMFIWVVGVLLVFAQGSALAPFIYTIF